MFSEDRAPQAEQVIMRTDCIALRGEAVKPCESASTQQLGKRRQDSIGRLRPVAGGSAGRYRSSVGLVPINVSALPEARCP